MVGRISGDLSLTLSGASNRLVRSFERLSSGKRVNRGADDAASLAVSGSISLSQRVKSSAIRNVSDGISLASIAQGAVQGISDIVGRLSTLSAQAANGTLSDAQRNVLNQEYQALREEIDRQIKTTEFNGRNVFSGLTNIQFGDSESTLPINIQDISADKLGLASDISTIDQARSSIDGTNRAQEVIASINGEIGGTLVRFGKITESIQSSYVEDAAALSRITDVDLAEESANIAANNISVNAAVSLAAQANISSEVALEYLV